jgi:hypothetical protein
VTQHTQTSIVALVCGTVFLLVGLFGIYYQGPFWASGTVAYMEPGEDAVALGLPSGVTLAGALVVSYVLLASPLTAHWTPQKRLVYFALFALVVLVGCGIAASLAGKIAAKKLQTTEAPSNQSVERMAAGGHLAQCRTSWAAASAHLFRSAQTTTP